MNLSAAYGPGKFGLSFELFPPKTPQGEATLFEHVGRLVEFAPSFITCTYGGRLDTRHDALDCRASAPRVPFVRRHAFDLRRFDRRSTPRISAAGPE